MPKAIPNSPGTQVLEIQLSERPIGAMVTGLDVTQTLSVTAVDAVRRLIEERAVVAIRGQRVEPEQLVAFARNFGKLQVNVRAEIVDGELPEITYISNVFEAGKPVGSHDAGTLWHADLCYLPRPSHLTFLYAQEVPTKNGRSYGATQFAGMAAAFAALDESVQDQLMSLTAAHGYRYMWNKKAKLFGKRPELPEKELVERFPPDAMHPVVRIHPTTGQKCLYVNEGYTRRIFGLAEPDAEALLNQLLKHATQERFIYRHAWDVGDILVWDNCAVQHKATFDYGPHMRRLMQRCVVEGDKPV